MLRRDRFGGVVKVAHKGSSQKVIGEVLTAVLHGEPNLGIDFFQCPFCLPKFGPEQAHSTTLRARRRALRNTMWYVYILKCADGLLYTGSTTDTHRRVKEHNAKKGSGCTRGRLPVKLVHKEPFSNRSEAQKREAQIKKWPRQKKLSLIYNDWRNPERSRMGSAYISTKPISE